MQETPKTELSSAPNYSKMTIEELFNAKLDAELTLDTITTTMRDKVKELQENYKKSLDKGGDLG